MQITRETPVISITAFVMEKSIPEQCNECHNRPDADVMKETLSKHCPIAGNSSWWNPDRKKPTHGEGTSAPAVGRICKSEKKGQWKETGAANDRYGGKRLSNDGRSVGSFLPPFSAFSPLIACSIRWLLSTWHWLRPAVSYGENPSRAIQFIRVPDEYSGPFVIQG